MQVLDLSGKAAGSDFVVYFGGRPNEVDTYTFANSLVALSDAIKVINAEVNPGFSIELRLEAIGEGSFKARIKEIPKSLKNALKFADQRIIWPILVTWFYTQVIAPEDTNIIINTNEVIIEKGGNRVIVPREAYNRAIELPHGNVGAPVAQAIKAVEADPNVSSFGIISEYDGGSSPALMIERKDFATIRRRSEFKDEESKKRSRAVSATLPIVKAVFSKGNRKWDFVWNGVKIGANIEDAVFLADVLGRKYKIGAGDALDVEMRIEQEYDDDAGAWLNSSYHIEKVIEFRAGVTGQGDLYD